MEYTYTIYIICIYFNLILILILFYLLLKLVVYTVHRVLVKTDFAPNVYFTGIEYKDDIQTKTLPIKTNVNQSHNNLLFFSRR